MTDAPHIPAPPHATAQQIMQVDALIRAQHRDDAISAITGVPVEQVARLRQQGIGHKRPGKKGGR